MTRLLFWIALVILVVMAVRSKLRAAMARAQGQAPQGRGPAQSAGAGSAGGAGAWQRVEDRSEPMACCAQCGMYFPASEAVRVGGRDFCSTAHAHQPAPR
ncbi:PP0621 family protein [Massilia sp. YIM B02763]|uniref:PP0621 family protein n=1 Tax=Massilia sp. YIM B02763 TaxID=3050130 RepID=UPI0025B665E6|nr:PP0621 family protein [Massilia sp. YIM B02763]MDN4055134.1 PP0621 family protein [Massilia sp. YIM B02763]